MSSLSTIIKSGETRTIHTGALSGNSSKSYTAICAADTFVAALQVRSTSGNVTVTVVGLSADGEFNLVEFPTLNAATSELIIRPAGTSLSNLRIDITHSDDCDIELSLKGTDVTQNTPVVSLVNSSDTTLSASATFTGKWENILAYSDISTFVYTSQASTLYIDFSTDGITAHRTISYSITATTGTPHKLARIAKYMRARLTNGSGVSSSTVALQVIYSDQPKSHLTTNLSATISESSDAELTRAVLNGFTDSGEAMAVPVDGDGHLEVALHSPRLPFGSIHTENLTPIFQTDSVYGINPTEINAVTGINVAGTTSATNTGTSNKLKCSTGTTAYSFASMQSRKRLRYRPGQGVVGRFTALFSTPAASSILVAGLGTSESGVFFGYNGTSFGILHSTGGVREIQTLTITTASTATNNYQVTLNNTVYNITATNNGSTVKTAYEIASGTYTGWKAEAVGSTVVFLADSAGNKAGTFSLAQSGAVTPAAGSFVETLAGVASNDTWIPQASWNGDKLDGTGHSGFTLNPAYGNVYQIDIQYLGFGPILFKVEVPHEGNNPTFVTAHAINFNNSQTSTSVSNPSFPFTMAAYSAGSTTDVYVECGSFAGFIEGDIKLTGPRMSFNRETNGFVGSTAATYYPLFTIRNDSTHAHSGSTVRANQSVVNLVSISASHDDATPIGFFIIRNATLVGTPNFSSFSPSSCIYWDTSATTCTITNNEQLIFVMHTGQSAGGAFAFSDTITIQPGETLTLAARAVTGTATYVAASLNTREDQ